MNWSILGAILKKDARSLLPLVTLSAVLFLVDAIILRLDLWPLWSAMGAMILLVVLAVLIIAVFQVDSPASLTEDWLCRPVRKRELLGAKVALVAITIGLPHAIGAVIADVSIGSPASEILVDALLLPDEIFLTLMPLLVFIAISTRTFIQAFGVLFAIFVCVFLIPTPFVREPGPLDLGLRDELLVGSGMMWLAMMPARLASLALVLCGFWLVYWRRNLVLARGLLVVTVCTVVFAIVAPIFLVPWKTMFALQSASGPSPPADSARISLHSTRACFPAAMRSQQSSDAAFIAAGNGLRLWSGDRVGAGPNSVAFVTAIEALGLPLDWRVKLNYAQANYSAGGAPVASLRPATYITDRNGGGALRHVWMLPESVLRQLQGERPQLQLAYSLTLLKPVHHLLPTDGKRRALPGIGWCSARVDGPGNRVEVDCFSAITHPAQISAQLNEMSTTRVHDDINFVPVWAQQPYGRRMKLAIGPAGLARHDTITVTAWEAAGSLDKSVTLPGILGGDPEACPLPERRDLQQAHWQDASPHERQSITVDQGVQLEVLDFGGAGSPLLLLPGLGATAHSFDELAPLLARKHRVVAMTRRGAGYSSKPDSGYDTPRLAQDVLQVMDAMGLAKVVLVGHSIAGDELTWLGGHHPDRFSALIYLDAACDRSLDTRTPTAARMRELGRFLPPEPPIPPRALLGFDAMTKLLLERGHLRMPEGELIAYRRVNDPALTGIPNIDGRAAQAIAAALAPPDYAAVQIPALAIYALEDPAEPLPPWYDANDKELVANLAERARLRNEMQRRNIELFRNGVENGQVLELQNADHYLFQSNQQQVLEAIEKYIAGLR